VNIDLKAQHFPFFAQKTGAVTNASIEDLPLTITAITNLNCTLIITQANKGNGNVLVTYAI
jgi:hypothetical protein